MITKEDLIKEISKELKVKEEDWVVIKTIRATQWGTRQAMAVCVPGKDKPLIIRTS
jgi:kynurenine formamidase